MTMPGPARQKAPTKTDAGGHHPHGVQKFRQYTAQTALPQPFEPSTAEKKKAEVDMACAQN